MAISKITLNGTTLMDATTATAAAADITAPKTAMLSDGVVTTGTGTGGGGGSSPIQLLGTVTVPSDVRAVNIVTTPFNSYDFYFCIIDATLTASDWLYVVKDGSSESGGVYGRSSSVEKNGLIFVVFKDYTYTNVATAISADGGTSANPTTLKTSTGAPENMYIYTYSATKLIQSGSTFKIYGGNYADM